jgi:SAM-dependent methyltransferase
VAEADPYVSGEHRWWSLSRPSPELLDALDDGWFGDSGRVLDLGCGLGTEADFLANRGFEAFGVDASTTALKQAGAAHRDIDLIRADVRALPFSASAFDYLIDRGTFHYLAPEDRVVYAREAARVLRPGGRFLLRACLNTTGVRNDIGAQTLSSVFAGWSIVTLEPRHIPSDTRLMPALVTRLERI